MAYRVICAICKKPLNEKHRYNLSQGRVCRHCWETDHTKYVRERREENQRRKTTTGKWDFPDLVEKKKKQKV